MKKKIMFVLLGLAVIYIIGVIIFSLVIVPTTAIGEVSVGFKSFSKIEQVVNEEFSKKQIKIEDPIVKDYSPKLVDLGATIDTERLTNDLKSDQSSFMWPFEIAAKSDYKLSEYIKYDDAKMKAELKSAKLLGYKGRTKPETASLKLNEELSKYEVVSATPGNVINTNLFIENLKKAIGANKESISTEKSFKTLSDEEKQVQVNADKLNERIARKVSMKIEDEEIEVPKDVVARSLSINENNEVEIVGTELYSYLYDASLSYDSSEVGYGYHNTIESNVDPAYDEIVAGLISDENKDIVGVAPVDESNETFKPTVKTDEPTYIEISISKQVMWVFKDDKLLVQTPVVTGSAADGWDTPTGDYTVISKETDKVLNGASVGFDYQVPVNYWMRLTNSGIGIHDIDWLNADNAWDSRDVYVTQGSHGCINTPGEAMKLIYNSIPTGTPVYIRN